MRSLIRLRWRQDRLPVLLYLVAFIVMTYPFVIHMRDSLPIPNSDTYESLSKYWSLRQALIQGRDLDHNNLLFHPRGLDVTLQPQRWSAFPLWTTLYTLFGDPFAFNLTSAFGILFKAYGMYLLGMHLFQKRIPAWVCGAFYAFGAPALTLSLRDLSTGATEWIPWFMLAFVCGIKRLQKGDDARSTSLIMLAAGVFFALNIYMNLKIAIFAILLGGGYALWSVFACRLWARRQFWLVMAAFAFTASATSAPLMLRTLRSNVYGYAIDRPVRTDAGGAMDLLNFVKADHDRPLNYRLVIAALSGDQLEVRCLCKGMSHVGVVGIVFALMGAVAIWRFQRKEAIWIVLTALAFALSLGVVFFVNGQPLDIYWTPYRLLQDNFFFRALWHPFRMVFVFLFPFSILVGYGLNSRLRTLRLDRRETVMLTTSVVMLLYGTSIFPIEMSPAQPPAYVSALATRPEGAVIDLPFGRHAAKYYMSLQRFHGRPIVEGMLPRTPPEAYDYIESNVVLRALQVNSIGEDSPRPDAAEWRDDLEALKRDGFRYVVLHREIPIATSHSIWLSGKVESIFVFPPPIYQDENEIVYDLMMPNGSFNLGYKDGYTDLPASDGQRIEVGEDFIMHAWSLLGSHDARPCQSVTIESWWELLDYNATPHMLTLILSEADGNGQVAIGEKVPADKFTTEWETGVFYHDRLSLEIPCSLASGKYLLLLGMKESMSGEPLAIRNADGATVGTLFYLTTITVDAI